MTRVVVFTLVFLGVWGIFTAVFAAAASKQQVRLLPKWVWVILCLIVPFFGGLLYLMVGRPLGTGTTGTRRAPKVVAPDDDPRFLRDLEKKMREQAERDKAAGEGAASDKLAEGEPKPEDEDDQTPKPKES